MAIQSFSEVTDKFNVSTTKYKCIPDETGHLQWLNVDVWLPRGESKSSMRSSRHHQGHPVLVFIHGGGLVTGHRAFHPFINGWLPGFAQAHDAIVVSPDYRLLPESTGQDVLEDLEDFWRWLTGTGSSPPGDVSIPDDNDDQARRDVVVSFEDYVAQIVSESPAVVHPDLSRILVSGGSAGGFCATHLALSHSSRIRSLLLQYPMVDIDSAWFREGNPAHNADSPNSPALVLGAGPLPLDDFLAFETHAAAKRATSQIVAEGGFERLPLVSSAQYYGKWHDWIVQGQAAEDGGTVKDVVVFRRMANHDVHMPRRIFVIQGTQDTAVPASSVVRFVELLKTRFSTRGAAASEVRAEYWDGLDHGFDGSPDVLDDPRLKDGLRWAADLWVGATTD
ncbi:hypothetical protein PV08_10197 [Exophiala spinifera]|uniref:Alpha/beta hydrolase fold-3 domain-containing protein n=1 Tax=Exophiala spinifera TaxID=91928 RepID=A0A0D2AVZ2_9EURO|nr:uncharacterized protein PV08_10197 [Exophiala spinifera]KIW10898.1 hypothetical protein PV08_10197 [Exophiala spinifera]